MKVLLTKNVPGTGQAGEIKEVSEGFARNFLLQHSLARVLTKHTTAMIEAQKRKRERLKKSMAREHGKLAGTLDRKHFTLAAKADEAGTLYAGLDRKAVAAALRTEGFAVQPDEVRLDQPIKKLGVYNVEIAIGKTAVNIRLEIDRR